MRAVKTLDYSTWTVSLDRAVTAVPEARRPSARSILEHAIGGPLRELTPQMALQVADRCPDTAEGQELARIFRAEAGRLDSSPTTRGTRLELTDEEKSTGVALRSLARRLGRRSAMLAPLAATLLDHVFPSPWNQTVEGALERRDSFDAERIKVGVPVNYLAAVGLGTETTSRSVWPECRPQWLSRQIIDVLAPGMWDEMFRLLNALYADIPDFDANADAEEPPF